MYFYRDYESTVVYAGHEGYVTSVCHISTLNDEFSNGAVITGSKDNTILVFPKYSPNFKHKLTGHTDAG